MLTEDSEADDMCLKCSDIIIITTSPMKQCAAYVQYRYRGDNDIVDQEDDC